MTFENFIALIIIAIFMVIGIVIKMKQKKQDFGEFADMFIEMYGDAIIHCMKRCVEILAQKPENFASKEEYEKSIIENTIITIKANYIDMGIDTADLGFFIDNNTIIDVVYNILHKNYKEVFADLSEEIIKNNIELYDQEKLTE